jgi:hypothetical protein
VAGRTMMAGRSGVVRSILLIVYLFLLSSGKSLISFSISFFLRKKIPFRLFHHPISLYGHQRCGKTKGGWCLKIE